jgi:hypothetical protein
VIASSKKICEVNSYVLVESVLERIAGSLSRRPVRRLGGGCGSAEIVRPTSSVTLHS